MTAEDMRRQLDKWIAVLERKAKAGVLHSMHTLADIYHYDGLRPDAKLHFEWTLAAAKKGDTYAAGTVGCHLRDGLSGYKGDRRIAVRKNLRLAFIWLKRAVELGDKGSLINLGVAYDTGEGTRKNRSVASRLYLRAYR